MNIKNKKWKNHKQIFPNGYTPDDNRMETEKLEELNIDGVQANRYYYAREMLSAIVSYYWNSDCELEKETIYSLLASSMPDGYSCLNTFGKKMLSDVTPVEMEENNAGFNYTGI